MSNILDIIALFSFLIGMFGVFVIFVGAFSAARKYIKNPRKKFNELRCTLAEHLILGLDFLLCKDVIDTLLLDSGSEFWRDLIGLLVVVSVRIVLTHFTIKEMESLESFELKKTPTKKSKTK